MERRAGTLHVAPDRLNGAHEEVLHVIDESPVRNATSAERAAVVGRIRREGAMALGGGVLFLFLAVGLGAFALSARDELAVMLCMGMLAGVCAWVTLLLIRIGMGSRELAAGLSSSLPVHRVEGPLVLPPRGPRRLGDVPVFLVVGRWPGGLQRGQQLAGEGWVLVREGGSSVLLFSVRPVA